MPLIPIASFGIELMLAASGVENAAVANETCDAGRLWFCASWIECPTGERLNWTCWLVPSDTGNCCASTLRHTNARVSVPVTEACTGIGSGLNGGAVPPTVTTKLVEVKPELFIGRSNTITASVVVL